MNNLFISLMVVILPIFGAIIGSFITNRLDRNKEINFENIKLKRDIYKKFIDIVIDIFQDSKNNKTTNQSLTSKKLYDFYKDYILYSSPEVINSYSDYMQYLFQHENNMQPKQMMNKLAKIMGCMRKDIGLSNRKLGKNQINIFKAMFKDFDEIKNAK